MATVIGATMDRINALIAGAKDRNNHTGSQLSSTISDLTEVIQDTSFASFVQGAGMSITYDDPSGKITFVSTGGSAVVGQNPVYSRDYTDGTEAVGPTTTKLQTGIDLAKSSGRVFVFESGKTFNTNLALNMQGDNLVVIGLGATINQTVLTQAIVKVGGEQQIIDGLKLTYGSTPASTDTGANGIEFTNSFMSVFSNLKISRTARGLYLPQAGGAPGSTSTNTVFSCEFRNIRINGYAISAISMSTYPYGQASSTGCVFSNIYTHNNYSGTSVASSGAAIYLRGWDEVIFNQLNLEHSLPAADLIFIQGVKAFTCSALHIEDITLASGAFFHQYESGRANIHSIVGYNNTILASSTAQRSLIKVQHNSGSPQSSVFVDGVRITNTINTTPRNIALAEIEANSTNAYISIVRSDIDFVSGSLFVDPTGVTPAQVVRINDTDYRASSGNLANAKQYYIVDKVGSTWPARPNADTTNFVFGFRGADPSPPIITSGTAGMYATDLRLIPGTT